MVSCWKILWAEKDPEDGDEGEEEGPMQHLRSASCLLEGSFR